MHEIADTQPGIAQSVITLARPQVGLVDQAKPVIIKAPRMSTASIGTDGKVTFNPIGDSKV